MPEPQLKKFGHLVTPHLVSGEQLLDIAVVSCGEPAALG
jgi:hypothetical protein